MKSDSFDVLAEAIADGIPIDMQEGTLPLEDMGNVLTNLDRIQAISNLGKSSTETKQETEPVFNWGHLQVFEKIGAGGYGEVYRAFDTVLQREVALKLCRTDKALVIGKRPYLDEARRLARVRHPGVLPVYGADEFDGRVGLWCELIHGTSLADLLQKVGPYPYKKTLQIAKQVSEALRAVHQSQMVHGDIKLSNLMSEHKKVWLMDFGAVTDLSQEGSESHSLMGTPMYMAPEIMSGETPTFKSDIYALGIALIRLSTGNFPFSSENFAGLLFEKQKNVTLSLPAGYPKDWLSIIRHCTSAHPAQRFSAKELLQALEHLEDQPRRKKKRIWIASVIMLLTLVASGFAGLSFQLNHQFMRADQEAHTSSRLVQMLTQMFDSARQAASPGEEISARKLVEQAIDQTKKEHLNPEIRMRLDAILGRVIRQLGNAPLSRDHLIQGIQIGSKKLPQDHPWLLRAKVELIYTYHVLSEFDLSIQVGEEVMPHAANLSPSLAVAFYTYLAESFQGAEKFGEALELFQKALELSDLYPEQVSPFQSSNANNQMALFYLAKEEPHSALPYLETSRKIMEKGIPKTHPNWALLFESFCKTHELKGDLREALAYAQQSHDLNVMIFTEIDPNIIASKSNLGRIHILLKEFEKGKALYLEALEMMEAYYPERDFSLATQRTNIGALMIELGEPQKSQELIEQVLPVFEEKFGRVSRSSNLARLTLGNAHLAQSHFEKADEIYQRLIKDCDAVPGSSVPKAMALNNLGESKTFQGKYKEGQEYIEQAIDIIQNLFGEKHPLNAEILIYLVDVFIESGQFEKAEMGLNQCQSIFEQSVPKGGIEFQRVAAWKAVLDKRRGNPPSNWPELMGDLETQMGSKSPEIEKLHKRWGFNDS